MSAALYDYSNYRAKDSRIPEKEDFFISKQEKKPVFLEGKLLLGYYFFCTILNVFSPCYRSDPRRPALLLGDSDREECGSKNPVDKGIRYKNVPLQSYNACAPTFGCSARWSLSSVPKKTLRLAARCSALSRPVYCSADGSIHVLRLRPGAFAGGAGGNCAAHGLDPASVRKVAETPRTRAGGRTF